MKKKKYNVAIVGATGVVGSQMLETLAKEEFFLLIRYALLHRRGLSEKR